MALVPASVGNPNAGSPDESPDGGARSYVSVPLREVAKSSVKRPTRVTRKFPGTHDWKKGVPLVTKASPTKRVGVVQVPPVITIQMGLKSLGFEVAASGSRGS